VPRTTPPKAQQGQNPIPILLHASLSFFVFLS
jgi:hypothetical protein